jgi:flavorubredoxin
LTRSQRSQRHQPPRDRPGHLPHQHAGPDPDGSGFSFNQYLIADEAPLLFHTGPRGMFPLVAEAIGKVLPLEKLRYVAFSHVEADECGGLNQLLAAAPRAVPVCSQLAAMVSVNDLADRPARAQESSGETPP